MKNSNVQYISRQIIVSSMNSMGQFSLVDHQSKEAVKLSKVNCLQGSTLTVSVHTFNQKYGFDVLNIDKLLCETEKG